MAYGSKNEILLESGTNEVEIAEFMLGTQSFGVNVAKIKEFVPYEPKSVTKIPNAPPTMEGVFLLRGNTIPLINLSKHLERKEKFDSERPVVLVTEFNNLINGFRIDAINQIHRLSWNDIKPLNPVLSNYTPRVTGTVSLKGNEILILDLEHIIGEIFPGKMKGLTEFKAQEDGKLSDEIIAQRNSKKIVIAEDSKMIRELIVNSIHDEGYITCKTFDNGKDAYNYVLKQKQLTDAIGKPISENISLIISDIEMPQMDGLTLCKKIKQEHQIKSLPVIMFSSLINEQMIKKCESVGADSYVSKPELKKVVSLIDQLLQIGA